RTFDNIAPTIALSTDAPNPTNTSPIPVVVTVSEALTGFTADDITVTGGTGADFKNVSDTKYTFNVIATGDGDVSVSVAAGKATDAAGNQNPVSNTLTRTFGGTGPNSTANPLSTNDTTPTLHGTVDNTATSVTVTVNGHTYTATINGTDWSADVTDTLAEGTYDTLVTATDSTGNSRTTTRSGGLTIDTTAPAPLLSTNAANPTNASKITVTVTFNQAVTGFDAADITVTNGSAGPISGPSGGTVYTFDVTPTNDGDLSRTVVAGAAIDAAGNPSTVSNTLTRTVDRASPTASITTSETSPTDLVLIPFTVTSNEGVTGFEASDITVTNGTVTN